MRTLALAASLLCTACVDHRYFAPRENLNGTGPGNHPAAVYPFAADAAVGEVRIWSRGSHPLGDEDEEYIAEVHVGFELENNGAVPLQLDVDNLQCEGMVIGEKELRGPKPVRTSGKGLAESGTTARVDLWFRPGPEVEPRDVVAFTVRFAVTANGAPVLQQLVPFAPYVREDYYHPYRYDPWMWGWGFGVGIHYCR
jgi:hypothetical protein